jgi:hypothetical protein
MKKAEIDPGAANSSGVESKVDVAVALMKTLVDGCVDREMLRSKFMEKFGGDRNVARVYFNLALRRLANAGEVAVMKSGGSEVICRGNKLAEVVKKWGDLINALMRRSARREIDPEAKTNGRIVVYLVRHGMLKTLAEFLCRGTKVWAYIDDPVDLSLILAALQHIAPRHRPHATNCAACSSADVALLVPRSVLLTYMAATTATEEGGTYVLKLPMGQTVRLQRIKTNCADISLTPILFEVNEDAFRQDDILSLIIYFVHVVD